MPSRTGAEQYFADQMRDPEYRRAYKAARSRVDRIDALVRSLDEGRRARGMTKAELARAAGIRPEAVRRLFTMESPNPTAGTLLALADVLDLDVVTRPKKRSTRKVPTKAKPGRAVGQPEGRVKVRS
ncbi:MAG TPA: helix-turn-helix domain-containing protein [Acidimicrobiia bacterium]|nr:helix-turn-helix domain-containing protein [Acidimicrobiia bacterium]